MITDIEKIKKTLRTSRECLKHARQWIKNLKPDFSDNGNYKAKCEEIDRLLQELENIKPLPEITDEEIKTLQIISKLDLDEFCDSCINVWNEVAFTCYHQKKGEKCPLRENLQSLLTKLEQRRGGK